MSVTPLHPRLFTPRLLLRGLQNADIEALAAYRSDPLVARHQSWEVPYTAGQARALLTQTRAHPPGTPGVWFQMGIELREGGQLIGDIGFRVLADDSSQAEIGFAVAHDYWLQGYGSEATLRLLKYLFEEQELRRVRARCTGTNEASAHLLRKVGMRQEGHAVEASFFKGEWADDLWFALLQREWLGLGSGQGGPSV